MKVTQDLINRIVERAKASNYGLSGESDNSLDISQYNPQDLESLALLLVSGWHEKYDLVSIFAAAMIEIEKEITQDAIEFLK